jgi:MFS family permease
MKVSRYRWFVLSTFFVFILLHQADKLLIGPLTTPIMESFGINEAQMGFVFSGAVVIGAIFYPIWGFLYDRFVRAKLLALASFIWGVTTWLSSVVRTYTAFIFTRASTGIDDSSYPGLYNMTADYFEPKIRGKINGVLQIAQPLGYLLGMVLALMLGKALGWRMVFYITGSIGVLLAIVIFFFVKEPRRGAMEPELRNVEQKSAYRFNLKEALGLFKKRSLIFLFANGFTGVFPWQVIQFWFFRYLEKERHYGETEMLVTMVIAILVLAVGYPVAGAIGDAAFKKTPRGRMITSFVGVLLGAIALAVTLSIPIGNKLAFAVGLGCTAFFMPFASPNVLATIYDVTLPEVRSSANAIAYFFEQIGSSIAPALAGLLAVKITLGGAILAISVSAWVACFVFLVITSILVPKDIQDLRAQLRQRAQKETGV